jgi:hypothetical protein
MEATDKKRWEKKYERRGGRENKRQQERLLTVGEDKGDEK